MNEIQLLTTKDVPECSALVAKEWGDANADRFVAEVLRRIAIDNWQLVGVRSEIDNELLGCGVLTSPEIDFELWGLTWVVVHENHRRRGIGTQIVDCIEALARSEARLVDRSAVMQLTTRVRLFYANRGYSCVFNWANTALMVKVLYRSRH